MSHFLVYAQVFVIVNSVPDPDPHQVLQETPSVLWIRILIPLGKNDPQKKNKIVEMYLVYRFEVLGAIFWGLEAFAVTWTSCIGA